MENLTRCGGWGMRYDVLKELLVAQGGEPLRMNAYVAMDREREAQDLDYRRRKEEYRNALRREGIHVVRKLVKRYRDSENQLVMKANADLDLAIDALLQSENLDYVLLGTGDGDFLRLVRALQSRGKRVDLLSFSNTSRELREEVDYHFSGYLVPGLISYPSDPPERQRGIMHGVNEEKGFGFLTYSTGLRITDARDDVFCHISDFTVNGNPISNDAFASLKTRQAIIEFDLVEQDDGRVKAVNATEFKPKQYER